MTADPFRETISRWIPPGAEVAIVDVPVHRNVGDLFILAATERLLAAYGCRIVYRAGARDYTTSRAKRHTRRDTIIVGLGGGNFGDRYPHLQSLRERVVADFPRNRIVILPQTIHFADRAWLQRAAAVFGAHPDLHIAVRDHASLAAARAFTSDAVLMPDTVHSFCAVSDVARPAPDPRGTDVSSPLVLLRRDGEGQRGTERAAGAVDWPDLFPEFLPRLATTALLIRAAPALTGRRVHQWWASYANDLLRRAVARMQSVERLVTDRLHAAIVARIAGRPVTLRDNGYGKLAAYYETWWRDDPDVDLSPQRPGSGVERTTSG